MAASSAAADATSPTPLVAELAADAPAPINEVAILAIPAPRPSCPPIFMSFGFLVTMPTTVMPSAI